MQQFLLLLFNRPSERIIIKQYFKFKALKEKVLNINLVLTSHFLLLLQPPGILERILSNAFRIASGRETHADS